VARWRIAWRRQRASSHASAHQLRTLICASIFSYSACAYHLGVACAMLAARAVARAASRILRRTCALARRHRGRRRRRINRQRNQRQAKSGGEINEGVIEAAGGIRIWLPRAQQRRSTRITSSRIARAARARAYFMLLRHSWRARIGCLPALRACLCGAYQKKAREKAESAA